MKVNIHRKPIVIAALVAIFGYIAAIMYGYHAYLQSPEGVLLYTPPAGIPEEELEKSSSFDFGFYLILLGCTVVSGLLSLISILLSIFVRKKLLLALTKILFYTFSLFLAGFFLIPIFK